MRTDILERKDDILRWIEEKQPKSYMCQQLGCKPETLNSYLKKMGIEYAGQKAKKGQYKGGCEYKPAMYYIENNIAIGSHKLKKKLIRDGLKEEKCELCGIRMWYNREIPLELHHKNGNHLDNHLENLMILCPNCHSIMGNNSGRAVKSKEEIQAFRNEARKTDVCIICGKAITKGSTYCQYCYRIQSRVVDRPDREKLKELIRSTSFLQIGKMYEVSDNAVRKWCDTYGLPRKSSIIKSYSDEEWNKI